MQKHSLYIDTVLKILRTVESLFAATNLQVGDLKLTKNVPHLQCFLNDFVKTFRMALITTLACLSVPKT